MGRDRLAKLIPRLAVPLQEAGWPVDPYKSEQLQKILSIPFILSIQVKTRLPLSFDGRGFGVRVKFATPVIASATRQSRSLAPAQTPVHPVHPSKNPSLPPLILSLSNNPATA